MKLSIVIVSYNVKYYLEQCLCSVRRACRGLDAEVLVVDNASSDGSADYIRSRFPDVRLVENGENAGFSRANNTAIRKAGGEYVLLLNPDTLLGEDTLAGCLRFMDEHPEAGAAGVAMLKEDGSFAWESRRGLPSPFTAFCKMAGLCALFPRSRTLGRYYMRYLDKDETNQIDVVSGAFCMVRRAALDKAGLLDEDFFMYGEDIDLSCRLLLCGYKNYYLPLRILHYKGKSTDKSSFRYTHVFYEAMLLFFDKHYRRSNRWLAPFVRTAVALREAADLFLLRKRRLSGRARRGRNRKADESYLFLGRAEAMETLRRVGLENKLKIDFVEADEADRPDGHLDPSLPTEKYDYVVYDTGAYSFATMLRLLSRGAGRARIRLAVFSAETSRLITKDDTYGPPQTGGTGG